MGNIKDISISNEELFRDSLSYQDDLALKELYNMELYKTNEHEAHAYLRVQADIIITELTAVLLNKPQKNLDENDGHIIFFLGSFIRRYYIISDLIMKGYDIEAITLMRSSLEVLARASELKQDDKKLEEKMPKMSKAIKEAVRLYGNLSKIAHNEPSAIAEFIYSDCKDGRKGASIHPVHSANLYLIYLDFHRICGIFFKEVVELYFRIITGYHEQFVQSGTLARLEDFSMVLIAQLKKAGFTFSKD